MNEYTPGLRRYLKHKFIYETAATLASNPGPDYHHTTVVDRFFKIVDKLGAAWEERMPELFAGETDE